MVGRDSRLKYNDGRACPVAKLQAYHKGRLNGPICQEVIHTSDLPMETPQWTGELEKNLNDLFWNFAMGHLIRREN